MKQILAFLMMWCAAVVAQADPVAETDHAKVTLVSEALAVTPGQPFHVAFDVALKDGWHIYWKNPGDSGLAPATHWTVPSGFAIGDLQYPAPKRIEIDGLVNYGFEGTPSLVQKIVPPEGLEGEEYSQGGNEVILAAELEYLICHEVCIPEQVELSLTLPVSETPQRDEAAFKPRLEALATPVEGAAHYQIIEDAIYLQLPKEVAKDAYFYADQAGVLNHAAPQEVASRDGNSVFKLPRGLQKLEGALQGVVVSGREHLAVMAEAGMVTPLRNPAENVSSLGVALLFAVIGGLLLNAMPCVFPVLSLKALAIARKADKEPQAVRRQGVAYLAGVLMSFLVLGGAILAFKQVGYSLGWGFQLQSPLFVTAMLIIFFLLGLSLIGMFHLPVLFGAAAQDAEQKDSAKGSFLTGILAVLVATPCAVPFMAPAVGYAFAESSSAMTTLLVMLALGVGLSLPYVLLAWIPALRKHLPKPGAWMNTFKEFMAFPMFASVAWLVWVLAQQVSLDGLAMILFLLVGLAFLIWLGKRWAKWLAALLVAYTLFAMYDLNGGEHHDAYKDLSQPFTAARLSALRAEGKPVFVNATAAWCITCKVNERVALRDPAFAEALKQTGVTYLIADWTNHDDAITEWLSQYGRSGVPLYVFYPANGGEEVVLPQLLTTARVVETLEGKTE